MSSVLFLPPPSKRQRISAACTAVFAFLIAGILLPLSSLPLQQSLAADKVEVWDFVALGVGLVTAGFFGWIGWTSRLEALPFRFIADASSRECGYRWRCWWAHRTDLSAATKLRGSLSYASIRPYQGTWTWAIHAVRRELENGQQIYRPSTPFHNKEDAGRECQRILQQLSGHLNLPAEFSADPAAPK